MKLILSRKGFDSSSGGNSSPILPDGRMISLPIPDKQSPVSYDDIMWDEGSIGPLVSDLTHSRIPSTHYAHIDPDLYPHSLPRLPNWRPIFGQTGAAQGHLRNSKVQKGDIFLFFGLFRGTVLTHSKLNWDPKSLPRHVIWGWMQIDEIVSIDKYKIGKYKWAEYHPHFHRQNNINNFIYFSKKHLTLTGLNNKEVLGAGIFRFFSESLQLTAPSLSSPSLWQLPKWFYPENGRTPLTYHTDLTRWEKTPYATRLRTSGRGQEFVLKCDEYPESSDWLVNLFRSNLMQP